MSTIRPLLPALLAITLLAPAHASTTLVTSTFTTGTDGWQPWSTATAGALTPGNPYLSVEADGSGVKGKLITFNPTAEWTGDYFSAGVTHIRLDVANMSATDELFLRVAIGNRASPMQAGGSWWLSKNPIFITTESAWSQVTLSIRESDLVRVGNENGELGTDSYQQTFSDVRNIRILSAVIPLGAIGDEFIGTVAMDNISLVVPEPTSALLLATALCLTLPRRKRPTS